MYNHLIIWKQMGTGSFKNVIYELCVYKSYNMYKEDLASNNLQW